MGQRKHKPADIYRLKVLSALLVSMGSLPASALDLGRLQVQSAIGEPLRAEIEIAEASTEELRSLRAQLGSPNTFRQAGLEYNPSLSGVTASLHGRNDGRFYVALRGQNPVQDTFIDLILEMQWATGRLVKNYALLLNSVSNTASTSTSPAAPLTPSLTTATLAAPRATAALSPAAPPPALTPPADPPKSSLNPSSVVLNEKNVPVYRFAQTESTPTIRVTEQMPGQSPAAVTRPTAPNKSAPESRAVRNPRADRVERTSAPTADGALSVRRGDTASQLALRHLSADVSLDQMLLAMLKANPDAFIEGNVNLIKAGATLRMPSASEAAAIPSSEARQTVLSQARDFAEYSRRLAGSALVVASKNTREMSGKVSAEAPREEEKAPAQDKLTLSKPLIEGGVAEAKIAKDQEIKDTSTQLAALTKNLEDLEKLAQTTSPTAGDASNVPAAAAAAAAAPQTSLMTSAPGPETAPPATRVDSNMSFLEEIQRDQRIWAWGAALMAAILLFIFWLRRSAKPTEEVYAPSYSDHLSDQFDPSATPKSFASTSGIPDQMSSIDLNLSPKEPVMDNTPLQAKAPVQSDTPAASEDTQVSKLELANQLLTAGDQDLARALILSVASSAQGDIKARALQMLGQIK